MIMKPWVTFFVGKRNHALWWQPWLTWNLSCSNEVSCLLVWMQIKCQVVGDVILINVQSNTSQRACVEAHLKLNSSSMIDDSRYCNYNFFWELTWVVIAGFAVSVVIVWLNNRPLRSPAFYTHRWIEISYQLKWNVSIGLFTNHLIKRAGSFSCLKKDWNQTSR